MTDSVPASRTLDGNATAGVLAEIFVIEPTVVRSTCARGTPAALGAHHLYADGPGGVVPHAPAAPRWWCASPGWAVANWPST